MKKTLLIIAFSLFINNSFAQSKAVNTIIDSSENLVKNNFKQAQEVQLNLANATSLVNTYYTCKDKAAIYVGTDADNADADGCIDPTLIGTRNYIHTIKPNLAGIFSTAVKGDLGTSDGVQAGLTETGLARGNALCNVEFVGSRMMTYDDIAFIHDIIPRSSYQNFWIGSALLAAPGADSEGYFFKHNISEADSANNHNCNGFTNGTDGTTPNENKGAIIKVDTANETFETSTILCGQTAHILCLYR